MKITVAKVIRELQDDYGWEHIIPAEKELIKHVLKIIDQKLKYHKGISIK